MTRVAVVGGGAAGMGAARELIMAGFDVTIFESGPRLGGNCVSVDVKDSTGTIHQVDAGVSDFNRSTFHEVSRLIDELGVPTHPISSDTDFVTADRRSPLAFAGGEWKCGQEVADPEGLRGEIETFRTRAGEVLSGSRFADWTVARYLQHIGASRDFQQLYLLPRAMGCFPMPSGDPEHFSIRALLRFWEVHGLIARPAASGGRNSPPNRHCAIGGMHRYVAAYADWYARSGGTLRCSTRVRSIARAGRRVVVAAVESSGIARRCGFDHVVLTCHAHQALSILEAPSAREQQTLARFPYQYARIVVHQDDRLLGRDRDRWGAFNYAIPQGRWPSVRPTITFFPNRLASLPPEVPDTFVTMNPVREPRTDRVLLDRPFLHPIVDARSEQLARDLDQLQGSGRVWFAGSYLAAPAVHESALTSGMHAARRLLNRETEAQLTPSVEGARWTTRNESLGAARGAA